MTHETTIHFTWSEMMMAVIVGVQRQMSSLRKGSDDRFVKEGAKGWDAHIEGAIGEFAVAKALNIHWAGTLDTYKRGGDIGANVQVRNRSRHDWELQIREDDIPKDGEQEQYFVLVTGTGFDRVVRGWFPSRQPKEAAWWKNHGGHGYAWFVPQDRLNPLHELEGVIRYD